MTRFLFVHPDPQIGRNIAATLQAALAFSENGSKRECDSCTPDSLAGNFGEGCFVIAATRPDSVPPERFCQFPASDMPVRLGQLLSRLETLEQQAAMPVLLDFGAARLDLRQRLWLHDGKQVDLTEKEVALLEYLWHEDKPVTREDLLRDVWDYAADVDTHTVETHIYRLRQKIERDPASPEHLLTTRTGYQIAARSKA